MKIAYLKAGANKTQSHMYCYLHFLNGINFNLITPLEEPLHQHEDSLKIPVVEE